MLKIKVILGSTRQGRFGDKPANWVFNELKKREDTEVELLDLRDYEMPYFNESVTPSYAKEDYANPVVKSWKKKIAEADGFVIVTPEYNHGYPAVLKNALDYVYAEWHKKPVAFVSWGSVGGARAVEQLRLVSIELQMAPIRVAIHIPGSIYMEAINKKEDGKSDPFEFLKDACNVMIDQLLWWGEALKTARVNV